MYNMSSNGYDIAIIKLRDKLVLDSNVQLACIPDSIDDKNINYLMALNTSVWAIGGFVTGSNTFGELIEPVANYKMQILDNRMCSSLLQSVTDATGVFCAGILFCLKRSILVD